MRSITNRFVIGLTMVAAIVLTAQQGIAYSLIQNGDFGNGETSWTTEGNVLIDAGYARLYDGNEPFYGTLYQGVEVIPGNTYLYAFEFQAAIDPVEPAPGRFSDLFATSLYSGFTNNFLAPTGSLGLFDLSGSSLLLNGEITNGTIDGYKRYFLTFTASTPWVFPTFDFFDNDQSTGSFARVALVQLEEVQSVVPEPSTLLLSLGGAACLWFVRFRKRS